VPVDAPEWPTDIIRLIQIATLLDLIVTPQSIDIPQRDARLHHYLQLAQNGLRTH